MELPHPLFEGSISVRVASLLGIAFILYLIATTLYKRFRGRDEVPLPPGPTGYPLIGSLPDLLSRLKTSTQHLLFNEWARQYGEIYKVNLGFVTQYMVNTDVAAKAIFEGKNASISANRPRWIVSSEYICHDWNVLLINGDTPRWKHQRRVTTTQVGSVPSADAGVPHLEYESLKFLYEVTTNTATQLENRAIWRGVMRYTYSALTSQLFGLDIPTNDSQAIGYIHETGAAQIVATLPGSYLVDLVPVLELLPTALKPWARAGNKRFARDLQWCLERKQRLEIRLKAEGSDPGAESMMAKLLADEKNLGFETKEEGAYFCLMLTIGAADTSQISTWSFIEAMLRYPDVQRKAQVIIDEAVGDRVPVWSDYKRIPYIRSLLKETWRWRPPVALGHPHLLTADVEYNGHRIPAGARVHLNSWAIQRDPARHADPESFIPERYEGDLTTVAQSINSGDVTKRDHFAFGAGRRICPG